jgi:hypothetical protein
MGNTLGPQCGRDLAGTGFDASVDQLEVRSLNKGSDPYAAPVQLFKGRPPRQAPTLTDADRIPVDLRPAPETAPWDARQPRQRQGWDRRPWAPGPSALAEPALGGGPRKLRHGQLAEPGGWL